MSPLERFPLIKCVSSPPINYHQPTHWLTDCAKNRVPCWIPRNNIEDTKHGRIHMKPITIIIDIIIGVLSCRSCLFPSFTLCSQYSNNRHHHHHHRCKCPSSIIQSEPLLSVLPSNIVYHIYFTYLFSMGF